MTCRPPGGCGHEFCWICLGDWTKHGSQTGGYYECNIYKESKSMKDIESMNKQEKEKEELLKYAWHYERHLNHISSLKNCDALLQ